MPFRPCVRVREGFGRVGMALLSAPAVGRFAVSGAVVKGSDLRLHQMVAGLVDEEMRGRMQSSAARKVEV